MVDTDVHTETGLRPTGDLGDGEPDAVSAHLAESQRRLPDNCADSGSADDASVVDRKQAHVSSGFFIQLQVHHKRGTRQVHCGEKRTVSMIVIVVSVF